MVALCRFVELKLDVTWVSDEKKKNKLRKLTLGPKMHQNASFGPQKIVDVMGLGCRCKMVDGGSVMSPR